MVVGTAGLIWLGQGLGQGLGTGDGLGRSSGVGVSGCGSGIGSVSGSGCGSFLSVGGWVGWLVGVCTGERGRYRGLMRTRVRAKAAERERMERDRWRLYRYEQGHLSSQQQQQQSRPQQQRHHQSQQPHSRQQHKSSGVDVKGDNSSSSSTKARDRASTTIKGKDVLDIGDGKGTASPFSILSPALHPTSALLLALVPMLLGPTVLTTLTGGSLGGRYITLNNTHAFKDLYDSHNATSNRLVISVLSLSLF